MEYSDDKHCGFIAIIGRPNVGKSTLMNRMLGQKISITSHRPQTTRHRLLGIKTTDSAQLVFVDTPGMHLKEARAMNRYMNKAADSALTDVDMILWVVEAGKYTEEDESVLEKLKGQSVPIILVLNKADKFEDKTALLPEIAKYQDKLAFAGIVPLSAKNGKNVDLLEETLVPMLPAGYSLFEDHQITDKSQRFLAAELVREKLMRTLGQELPYALTVEILSFKEEDNRLNIHAVIWVERDGQKKIVIGKGGRVLKEIGTKARQDMERLFGEKIYLDLWVKVKQGWSDDERALLSLGYQEDW